MVAVSTLAIAASPNAQRAPAPPKPKEPPKDGQEFTKQGLLIVNFTPRPGADMKLARKAADAVRSRVGKLVNKREVDVLDGDDIAWRMERAGYNPDTSLDVRDIRAVGKYMRADEFIVASISNGPSGPRIQGELVLFRDERLRQPLPEVSAPKLDSAAGLFARSIAAARSQLIYERRCENALRDGSASRAVSAARQGIATFEQGAIARTCLVWALRQNKTSVETILTEANAVLAIDSMNARLGRVRATSSFMESAAAPDR